MAQPPRGDFGLTFTIILVVIICASLATCLMGGGDVPYYLGGP